MNERRSQSAPKVDPAPVAGAVEALESILAICNETREARDLQPRMTEIRSIARASLAALHPQPAPAGCKEQCWACAETGIGCNLLNDGQPAPAVAVEAAKVDWYERHQDECTRDFGEYDESASLATRLRWWVPKSARHGRLQLEDDLLEASGALAARSAPAVAEKVPLTDEQMRGILRAPNGRLDQREVAVVRMTEWLHGVGSGSAQEGQANG